jgi:hypothetical protein
MRQQLGDTVRARDRDDRPDAATGQRQPLPGAICRGTAWRRTHSPIVPVPEPASPRPGGPAGRAAPMRRQMSRETADLGARQSGHPRKGSRSARKYTRSGRQSEPARRQTSALLTEAVMHIHAGQPRRQRAMRLPHAHVAAIISGPIFDVFAVNGAAPSPGRGCVIFSGVSAVPEAMPPTLPTYSPLPTYTCFPLPLECFVSHTYPSCTDMSPWQNPYHWHFSQTT